MKKWVCVLGLSLLPSLALSAAEPSGRSDFTETRLSLPMDVTTPDGTRLPAGEYSINVRQQMLKLVGRPPTSLGYWPGPNVYLSRSPMGQEIIEPRMSLTLKTAVHVQVVYDFPAWEAERREARLRAPEAAPYIRNHQLIAILYRGELLYITEAKRGVHWIRERFHFITPPR